MTRNIVRSIALAGMLALGATTVSAAPGGQSNASPVPATNAKHNPNVTVTNYEDWKVLCPKSNQARARCRMTQIVENPANGKPIMQVVMAYPPRVNGPVMFFVTPLGTRLAPGLTLRVGGGKAHHIPFQICRKNGCQANYMINSSLLNAMKQGLIANVQLVGPRGKKINLNISLQGFTASNNKIKP